MRQSYKLAFSQSERQEIPLAFGSVAEIQTWLALWESCYEVTEGEIHRITDLQYVYLNGYVCTFTKNLTSDICCLQSCRDRPPQFYRLSFLKISITFSAKFFAFLIKFLLTNIDVCVKALYVY